MCGLVSIQLSFNFLESIAIFIVVSLFTVITSDTKQSSSKCFTFSTSPVSITFLFLYRFLLGGLTSLVSLFVLPENVPASVLYLYHCLLSWYCSRIGPGTFRSLFSFLIGCSHPISDVFDCQIDFFHPVHSEQRCYISSFGDQYFHFLFVVLVFNICRYLAAKFYFVFAYILTAVPLFLIFGFL